MKPQNYILFTDTDTDITPELADKYGYKLISMPYFVGEKEIKPYVDFKEFDSKAFYQMLREGTIPTTTGLSPQDYINYFEEYFKNGLDIVYVHFSAAMTGTFNSMNIALNELKEKYPDRKLYAIDTKGITLGSYNLCLELGEMYSNGASIDELINYADKEVQHFAAYFYADDLKFFHKSGRVNGFSAFFGNMIGIKPIIYMDKDGKMSTFNKFRGRKNALKMLINIVNELQDDLKSHRVIITTTDSPDIAKLLEKMLREKFGEDLNIEYAITNPTAGSHCGPDGVGISFHAIHR